MSLRQSTFEPWSQERPFEEGGVGNMPYPKIFYKSRQFDHSLIENNKNVKLTKLISIFFDIIVV